MTLPSPTPLRFALLGTGRIGQVHAASVAASPDAVLQVACDTFVEGAERTVGVYGGRATSDPLAAIAADDVDAVIVASPTPTHVDLIEACVEAGVPVLCEKPIDLDITRVDAVRDKVRASSTPVVLGFNRRFDPHFAALRARVRAGEIGRLEHLAITSRDPEPAPGEYIAVSGGIFRDMTIHDFDMARAFLPDIVEVTAVGFSQFSDVIKSHGDYDAAVVTMRAAGGESVVITNSRHSAYGYDQRLEAFGPDGLLQVDNVADDIVRASTQTLASAGSPFQRFFLERYKAAYSLELAAFVATVRGEDAGSPDFEDGRAALLLADAATRSAAEGRAIAVDLS
ncbi:Gfo/Idh/MocA family oxidoreductase [Kineococcus gynurae]|uniref:Gfo/Idh/MocA family oxidoreductase n=1 Tax=Kineococcus gynurae TaxID=452979 RepID=A0ABV5LRV4_9ACTN